MAVAFAGGYSCRMPDKPMTPEEILRNKRLLTHVKAWLRFRDKTQRNLAEALDVSEPSVSKWLRGKGPVTVAQFVQIAQFLDAEPEELLNAPPDADKARRYRRIAEVARDMPDDALEAWLSLGKQLATRSKPG
jgi:transcriptional regulator with XRE-family HTH domain